MAQQRRGGRRRRKVDFIAANHIEYIDYKDTDTSAKNQRKLTVAIKRARIMGLLPFVAED